MEQKLEILCGLSHHALYRRQLYPKRCVCMRACLRARACARVRACVRVCVCVTPPLLKALAYLAKLAARRNFHVLMHEIYYMGVVPSTVQSFRK